MPTFAAVLAHHRTRAGLSQARLAALAGFDHSAVSGWESGRRHPTRETVVRLADVLGLADRDRAELFLAGGFVPDLAGVWVMRETWIAWTEETA